MAFTYDPEFAHLIAAAPELFDVEEAAPGDWHALREMGNTSLAAMASFLPDVAGITRTDLQIPGYQDADLAARLYQRDDAQSQAALVYVHGGGMVLGSVEVYDKAVAGYVAETGVPMLSVDYRLAPEYPHPVPVEDCFAALRWLHSRAGDYGIDTLRVGVMGDSAGGGLAAATAILARDRGVPVARQILVYPMLDDRTVAPDPELASFATWSYDANRTGWDALLGERRGTDDVPAAAAPARAADLAGLAPAYIEVGGLDIFRAEDVEYARRLGSAGVTTELHVHPGLPHGFDVIAAGISAAQRSRADRIRVIQSL